MCDLTAAFEAIDAANSEDPNQTGGQPLALQQGRLASGWLAQICADPSPELQIAVRAHHLRRWEISRADYPDGRSGYLRWRKANKAHQASSVGSLLDPIGFSPSSINRVKDLLLRKGLGSDAETQALEDSACLVFMETQFDKLADRLDHERIVNAVYKTLKKMSSTAIKLVAAQPLSAGGQQVLAEAVDLLEDQQS